MEEERDGKEAEEGKEGGHTFQVAQVDFQSVGLRSCSRRRRRDELDLGAAVDRDAYACRRNRNGPVPVVERTGGLGASDLRPARRQTPPESTGEAEP